MADGTNDARAGPHPRQSVHKTLSQAALMTASYLKQGPTPAQAAVDAKPRSSSMFSAVKGHFATYGAAAAEAVANALKEESKPAPSPSSPACPQQQQSASTATAPTAAEPSTAALQALTCDDGPGASDAQAAAQQIDAVRGDLECKIDNMHHLYAPGRLLHLQKHVVAPAGAAVHASTAGARFERRLVVGGADSRFEMISLRDSLLADHSCVALLDELDSLLVQLAMSHPREAAAVGLTEASA